MRSLGILAVGMLASSAAVAVNPVVIRQSVDVNASADHVWSMYGSYCDISKFMKLSCAYAVGNGDFGSVRKLNGQIEEPMVAKTAHSYTYGQTAGNMKDRDYYGTLAVEPTGAKTSRVFYTLVYDQDKMPADQREKQHDEMKTRFKGVLDTIKAGAEGK